MQIDIITNRGNTTLESLLRQEFKTCESFELASAFITESALAIINKIPLKVNGRILISLYNSFNSKSVLEGLMKLSKRSQNIQVRISRNQKFHWKYYRFDYSTRQHVYIGSANFTNEGLNKIGEVISLIRFSKQDKSQSESHLEAFNKEWEESFPIIDFPVNKYKQAPQIINNSKLHPDILKLFQHKPLKKFAPKSIELKAVEIISDDLTAKTIKILAVAQSHWEKNNWNYFACVDKSEYEFYRSKETFLMIEYYKRQYHFAIAQKLDDCHGVLTPDGKYFIAYKNIKRRKETLSLKEDLKKLNFNYRSRNFNRKSITKKQELRLRDFFSI